MFSTKGMKDDSQHKCITGSQLTLFISQSIEASKSNYEEVVSGLDECNKLYPRPIELGEPLKQISSATNDDDNDKPFRSRSEFHSQDKTNSESMKASRFDFRKIPDFLARTATRAMAGYNRALSSSPMPPMVVGRVGIPGGGAGLPGSWEMMGLP